jgi:hypothetical protein
MMAKFDGWGVWDVTARFGGRIPLVRFQKVFTSQLIIRPARINLGRNVSPRRGGP